MSEGLNVGGEEEQDLMMSRNVSIGKTEATLQCISFFHL